MRDEQAGFRRGRNTAEQIFILRNIIEQVAEWQTMLHVTFVDFEKAFGSVLLESLWKIRDSDGIHHKIIRMGHILHPSGPYSVQSVGAAEAVSKTIGHNPGWVATLTQDT